MEQTLTSDSPEMETDLHELCESIGDAEHWILYEDLEPDELEQAKKDVAGWKAQYRKLAGHPVDWEPETGDWRMGCY